MKISLMALVAGFCLVVGLPLAATAGPTAGGADTDGDGVGSVFDNCTAVSNANQKDGDHDGCGDSCDGDLNQSGFSGVPDFGILKGSFNKGPGQELVGYNPIADMNCSGGLVGVPDVGAFIPLFNKVPGPSGFPASQRHATACP